MPGTTTRPVRVRKAAPAKATPTAKAAEPETAQTDGNVERLVISLVHAGDTKQYSKWTPPEGTGCVGTLYAPLGATDVKVAIKGGDAE